jgi:hypothetical protein
VRALPPNLAKFRFMNILINDAKKLEDLRGNHRWTKRVAGGKDFRATGDALAAAKKRWVGSTSSAASQKRTSSSI